MRGSSATIRRMTANTTRHVPKVHRLDADAACERTACRKIAAMAFSPGMGLRVRHRACAAVALCIGADLSRHQSDLDLDAMALGNGRARRAKLRADRAHGAGA